MVLFIKEKLKNYSNSSKYVEHNIFNVSVESIDVYVDVYIKKPTLISIDIVCLTGLNEHVLTDKMNLGLGNYKFSYKLSPGIYVVTCMDDFRKVSRKVLIN